eukprot:4795651-Pyramimonas_sp.AAC.1
MALEAVELLEPLESADVVRGATVCTTSTAVGVDHWAPPPACLRAFPKEPTRFWPEFSFGV